jgi:nicotinic acid phosphoribosyltransferase
MMKTYRVFVTGTVEHTFTVEAQDEYDAQSIAEQNFIDEFSCMSGGFDVGFDSVESWDAEEA